LRVAVQAENVQAETSYWNTRGTMSCFTTF
jgi:hypothetical protein